MQELQQQSNPEEIILKLKAIIKIEGEQNGGNGTILHTS
jgi:hypothetical protein